LLIGPKIILNSYIQKSLEDDETIQGAHDRPTWAEIDLDALASNFQIVRRIVGPSVGVMAVVKANAYGHGAVRCAKRLEVEGADWFGVALPEEGIELRRAGITRPILCLGGFWPGQAGLLLEYDIVPAVYRLDMLEEMNSVAVGAGRVADAHLMLDTGMGRLGVRFDDVQHFAGKLASFGNVRIDGVMTHFAAADDPSHNEFTHTQAARYQAALQQLESFGLRPTYRDLANSAATVSHSFSRGNLVRPGGVLYGLWRDILQPMSPPLPFRNVMSLYSRIVLLKRVPAGESIGYVCTYRTTRESLIATMPVGYHDGFVRANSNRGKVMIRGHFAPVVGRVSMDLTIVDVTDVPDVKLHDKVTLLGRDGGLELYAEDMARMAGTLSYEITCGISERVRREIVVSGAKRACRSVVSEELAEGDSRDGIE
jgi:alanine racemase